VFSLFYGSIPDTLPPLAVTEAHKVCFRDVMFSLLSARIAQTFSKNEKSGQQEAARQMTYAVARSFQESE
jgi:hypothetical protein